MNQIGPNNAGLRNAARQRKDEFYTQLTDIERELRHYKEYFKGKVVYCNCDDPRESGFFHYFSHNYEFLGLKKLITTCYKSQSRDLFSRNDSERAVYLEYLGDRDGNMVPDKEEVDVKYLEGDGDFRSEECIELLKEADIVVTNPPFSLFRDYVAQLIEYDKKFLIIGNQNAIAYKEIFPLFKNNKMWFGYGFRRNCAHFINKHYINYATDTDHRDGMIRVSGVAWYTNFDISKRHEDIILYKEYTPEEYPTYTNYPAIEVSKVNEIPKDYYGEMGVPITFLDKHNPEQFDIIGISTSLGQPMSRYAEIGTYTSGGPAFYLNNGNGTHRRLYNRIVIKRKVI
jgi:hypothetical protein